jgi:hypothetical protein
MQGMIEGPWAITAAVASAAVLILYIVVEFLKPWLRYRRLKAPCDVSFSIPEDGGAPCEYAVLDSDAHATKEITVPPNSEFHLELRFVPKLNFVESEFGFGCDSHHKLDKKPFAVSYLNHFVELGKTKSASPLDNDDHYIDRHKYYHIRRRDIQRAVGQHFTVGLIIKTRDVGIYNAEAWITTEGRQGIHSDLKILVEERPQKTRMKCILHDGCYIRPNVQPADPRA